MTGPQLFAIWALLALAVFGIPGAALGWWAGRAALRRALDTRRLAPVEVGLRILDQDTAPTMPLSQCVEPASLWSEHRAAQAHHDREAQAALARHERDVAQMIAESYHRIPYR
jgi:hypothetical protein